MRRQVVVVILTVAAMLGSSAAAMASTAPDAVPTVEPAQQVGTGESAAPAFVHAALGPRTITLGPKATKRIIGAFTAGGLGAAQIACAALVPLDIKQYCGAIVSMLAAIALVGGNGDKCLAITVGLGMPPVRVSLVPCPVFDPELVPGDSILVQPLPVLSSV